MSIFRLNWPPRRARLWAILGLLGVVLVVAIAPWAWTSPDRHADIQAPRSTPLSPLVTRPQEPNRSVRLSEEQQRSIGLATVKVESGSTFDVLSAPGRVAPDETRYALVTPRAPGVVRSVHANIGQQVKAG